MSGELVIEAHGLVKRYGATRAVDGIDLAIRHGEIFGLLGPNGAGKTTVILMLLGLTETSAGSIRVVGFDPVRQPLEVKRRVGYMPDAIGFYDNLTARQNLRYTARLAGMARTDADDRITAALSRVRLSAVADQPVSTFSRGMRQRLGLAEIWLKRAAIAILDEPTSGLDPQSTAELLDMIRELKAEGVTILLSSHLLDRVQSVCDRVGLFNQGRIALLGTVGELASTVLGGDSIILVEAGGTGADGKDVAALLAAIPGVRHVTAEGGGHYRLLAATDIRAAVAQAVVGHGSALRRLNLLEPSLDTIYARYFEEERDAA